MSEHETSPPPAPGGPSGHPPLWEREALRDLAMETVRERRRARRWGILFKALFLIYLTIVLLLLIPKSVPRGPHTALIDIQGIIAEDTYANADAISGALRRAYESKQVRGIILRANSPGGSPVQAGYIYDEIMRLRRKYPQIPVYAVISDVCASACYYIVSATERVYANRASLVGSIGVLYDGFGFTGLMDKLGIERRLLTAGENKALLDPFSPLNPKAQRHLEGMLGQIHEQFIGAVRQGRGERLAEDEEIFSGLIWTGDEGMDLGLVDELASAGHVAREVIGQDEIIDYSPARDWLERVSERIGQSVAQALWSEAREPALR